MKRSRPRSKRRLLFGILVVLLSLCVGLAALSALSNLLAPKHSQVVDRLGALEKARLAEAIHLRHTLGDKFWPGWGQSDIPVILYNEEYAFLTGYNNPPPGWVKVPQNAKRGGPWEIVPNDTFDGKPYYRQKLVQVTPQAFTVLVGERWVASMTTREWMSIALPDSLSEQLPAPARLIFPKSLAAGLLVGNSDKYISLVLHESFHAYEGMIAPGRLAAAEDATKLENSYPWEEDKVRAAWQAELGLLTQAVQAKTEAETLNLTQQFLATREQRRMAAGLSAAFVEYERQREWLEGLAKYAELGIWREAATTPGYKPLPELGQDADFKNYADFDPQWSREVGQIAWSINSQETRFYYSGWAQATLLDRLTPGWKARILAENVMLEDLLREAAQ